MCEDLEYKPQSTILFHVHAALCNLISLSIPYSTSAILSISAYLMSCVHRGVYCSIVGSMGRVSLRCWSSSRIKDHVSSCYEIRMGMYLGDLLLSHSHIDLNLLVRIVIIRTYLEVWSYTEHHPLIHMSSIRDITPPYVTPLNHRSAYQRMSLDLFHKIIFLDYFSICYYWYIIVNETKSLQINLFILILLLNYHLPLGQWQLLEPSPLTMSPSVVNTHISTVFNGGATIIFGVACLLQWFNG